MAMVRACRKVCLVTAGGDAPGVNAVVRAFVHQATRRSIAIHGSRYGFEGLVAVDGLVPLSLESVRGILPKGGSILGCSTRINPFFYTTKEQPQRRDMGPAIADRLRSDGFDAMVLVGGDGTMHAARRFMQEGMPCVGVPKTIDNDLGGTDATCGFDSAVDVAAHAVEALHSTAEAHQRVMIVEVMGRYTGWIALRAGLAGGADIILIPEIPYAIEPVIAKIREREALGRRFTIIVVAEGATPRGGKPAEAAPGRPGLLPRLGGEGERLARELESRDIGHEIRVNVLGHLQRGGAPSAFDRMLGTRFGVHAATLCDEAAFGRMTSLRGTRVESILIEEALRERRAVDPAGDLVATAEAVGVELGGRHTACFPEDA